MRIVRLLGHPPPALMDLPLHGGRASRAIEALHASALPPHTLMQRAGLAVVRLALAVAPQAQRAWIACGPGNNGGDGLEAAMHLHRVGWAVRACLVGDAAKLPGDAAASLVRARDAGVPIADGLPDAVEEDLVIDALLGLGANRAPEGRLADAIALINRARSCTLAVDLPSGLPADAGFLDDPSRCVRADHTLALLTAKPGLFTAHGRDQAGTVWLCDLDAGSAGHACDAWLSGSASLDALRPARRHATHKGSFGSVAVIGGAPGMTGAALLAARAALRRGAGRVYVHLLAASAPLLDAPQPELMLRSRIDLRHDGIDAVVCGCGGGDAVRGLLPEVLSQAPRLVLDADALNAIADDTALQALLAARGQRHGATVITPHPLEAARLLGVPAAAVQADRLAHARTLAQRFNAVALVKGSGTVIATPAGETFVNPSGNAALATAGTGDVLAGWIGALLAQGLGAADAARLAVFEHGAAADRWAQSHPGRALPAGELAAA
jgi:ADP-dependent NAD(P)H-hydrate dehydratase / NAD(P)H-hydrate epimerase